MKISKLTKNPLLAFLIVWFSIAWSWSFFTDMLDLAGSKRQGYILAVFVVILNVTITTTVIWQTIKLMRYVQKTYSTKWMLAIGLPIFALADFLASWLTTIIWIGPQGQVDNVLPMGSMALPMVNTPFKFASRFVGFYGLAALLWFFIYFVSQKKTRKLAAIPLVTVSCLSLIGWAAYRNSSGIPVKATLVSEKLTDRTPAINATGSDLVVFPEYGLEKVDNKNLNERIMRTRGTEPKVYFVGSEQIYSTRYTGHINNMKFGNTTDGITQSEHKWRLIPAGEDLPYTIRTLLRATGQKSTLDYFSYAKGVIKGQSQLHPFVINEKVHVAAAVCSSIIAPQDYRDFARNGATLFTNSASLSIFQGSPLFAWQQKSLARFMAVANNRYFLQSANAASAYALDSNGHQFAEIKGRHTLVVTAQTRTTKTFYAYTGEWLAWLGGAITLILGIVKWRKRHDTVPIRGSSRHCRT